MKEEELIAKCIQKDIKAQKFLYDEYATQMFRLCQRYLKDEMAAEDAVINGFYKVFEKCHTFQYRGEGSVKAWIKRIMVNESLMVLRNQTVFSSLDCEKVESHGYESLTISELEKEDIYAAILLLPVGYRTVFNLFVVEGFSHKEIAERLRIKEDTSKSQLSKAKLRLMEILVKKGIVYGV